MVHERQQFDHVTGRPSSVFIDDAHRSEPQPGCVRMPEPWQRTPCGTAVPRSDRRGCADQLGPLEDAALAAIVAAHHMDG
jgi:hypothetical protein